ncbi:GntR family transcriptional regulator [Streptomyces tateyamensis]|uniref:GntR family transcriptional regulator n=1 Tax=Streptomyces tateyamensis TaxID=565073 RepID=A0A2V4N701_9ACTN|nr:FadR/GntR family transcriptional regulator [Streptomyces tateyamensis]PYC70625.1 GntR family transcriptional regulator [Streptomyces tateyamensis]
MAVTDQAIDRIKEMIVHGALHPGTRLPPEAELAEQLGLSRSSLREAVRALTAMRILVTKQGDGTYVSGLEPHLLLEAMTFAADVSHGHSARQLLQVRRLLEPQAVALAAGKLTDPQLRALRSILDRCTDEISIEEFIELDIEFHRTIADSVGNPVLSTLLGILSTHTQRVRIVRGTVPPPPDGHLASAVSGGTARQQAHREHEAIWRALVARDAGLAAGAAAVHVAAVEDWLADRLPIDTAAPEPTTA